jgi:hypothetical protein
MLTPAVETAAAGTQWSLAAAAPPIVDRCAPAGPRPQARSAQDWLLARIGQPDREGATRTYLSGHIDRAAEFAHDAVHHCKAKPGALASVLRGKEWIEHAFEHSGGDATAGVADAEAHIWASGR